jgi:hypothetical protein
LLKAAILLSGLVKEAILIKMESNTHHIGRLGPRQKSISRITDLKLIKLGVKMAG